jgi:hypothetical protein
MTEFARWSQRPPRLLFMDEIGFILVFEFCEPAASRRGSAWDRWATK